MSIARDMEALGIRVRIHKLLTSPDVDMTEVRRLEERAQELEGDERAGEAV